MALFAILQKYDFSSKSQPDAVTVTGEDGCLRYCKSTIFQANHNWWFQLCHEWKVVCDTAKVRFFKQITTLWKVCCVTLKLFAILQKYDFSSKSQLRLLLGKVAPSCLRYCKSTIFQANHNAVLLLLKSLKVVCDTAKVRFFKQITTGAWFFSIWLALFAILQKYDFSSKSQRMRAPLEGFLVVCDTAKVRFFKQITTIMLYFILYV